MKKSIFALCVVIALFTLSSAEKSYALLMVQGTTDMVVYDDVTDMYWFWDLSDSRFHGKTYSEQVDAANHLNDGIGFNGRNDWHMASLDEIVGLWEGNSAEDILDTFNPTWSYQSLSSVYGRYDEESSLGHYSARIRRHRVYGVGIFVVDDGYQIDIYDDLIPAEGVGAWVVSSGMSPVPEPSTFFLLLSGIAGIAFWRKKR